MDKLLADRFKKRGMRWSVEGADILYQVIEPCQNGELSTFLTPKRRVDQRAERTVMASLRKVMRRDRRLDSEITCPCSSQEAAITG